MSATCRSCGAAVIWLAISPGARAMPIDAEPHADGNVLADLVTRRGIVLSAGSLEVVRIDTPDEPLYRSHFATCPDADAWRRKR
jgi:hypothetical protein